MKIVQSALILCAFFVVTMSSVLAGGTDPAHLFYGKIEKIESLSANFKQDTLDHEGFVVQSTSGMFMLARPGKIYWKAEPPYEQLVVGNDQQLWVYDPDLEQVTVRPAEEMLEGPLTLLSESAEILENKYDIDVTTENTKQIFELVPRAASGQSSFASLQMTFVKDVLETITIIDRLRQKTVIALSQVALNTTIAPETFVFEVPEGVDVVTNE